MDEKRKRRTRRLLLAVTLTGGVSVTTGCTSNNEFYGFDYPDDGGPDEGFADVQGRGVFDAGSDALLGPDGSTDAPDDAPGDAPTDGSDDGG